MIVKLLTERHLEFLSFKGGCTGSSESTLVKMSNCWKSHATALLSILYQSQGVSILRKTMEGYLDSVPYLTFNTIKTYLIMHAFHSSGYLQSK